MANIKSAIKRIKTTKRNTLRNQTFLQELKTLKKKAEAALATKLENSAEIVKHFCSRVDSAVSKGIIHQNKAARLKSRISLKSSKAKAA